jgi:hypothetical protein
MAQTKNAGATPIAAPRCKNGMKTQSGGIRLLRAAG